MKNKIDDKEILIAILIGILMNVIFSSCFIMVNKYLLLDLSVNSHTIELYGEFLTGVMGIVFISTSFLSNLSDKSDKIYWQNTSEYVLIKPHFANFHCLSTYSYISLAFIVFGFCQKSGEIIISGSLLSVLMIVILFYRMTRIYFKRAGIVNELKNEFFNDFEKAETSVTSKEIDSVNLENFERKVNIIVANTIISINECNLDTLVENLSLLFSVDCSKNLYEMIKLNILKIYKYLIKENSVLIMSAFDVYKKCNNIDELDELIYNTSLELKDSNDNELKDYLCELYIKKMKMDYKNSSDNRDVIDTPKKLAKILMNYKNCSTIKDNGGFDRKIFEMMEYIQSTLTINNTGCDLFYSYLEQEFSQTNPATFQWFISEVVDWDKWVRYNSIGYQEEIADIEDSVTYRIRSLFVGYDTEPSNHVMNAKDNGNCEEYKMLQSCLKRISECICKQKYLFDSQNDYDETTMFISDNVKFALEYYRNLEDMNILQHIYEYIGNGLYNCSYDDNILEKDDLLYLLKNERKDFGVQSILLRQCGDDYLENYDPPISKFDLYLDDEDDDNILLS